MATEALKAGDLAPEIRLDTDTGETFELSSLKGKTVVLYFYPKADTPGCTTESCDFRDNVSRFKKKGVEVIGISPDKVEKQAKFKAKYELTFPLLADVDQKVAEAYGVWQLKKNYGKEYMGIVRSTFIIDKAGKIARVFSGVKVDGHVDAVFAALPK
jgi:peroxiredoxin Q/BCP